jgi:hypothetical protein
MDRDIRQRILNANLSRLPHPVSLIKIRVDHPDDWEKRIDRMLDDFAFMFAFDSCWRD